ncbi:MAG: T9SS type A sorting domain-containing protein [Calditrichaceae bacterium]
MMILRILGFVLPLILLVNSSYSQQTIKICAIRVEFLADENELTSGDGKFMIDSTTTDPFAIDPAPHNRTYFNDQMLAAANYYQNVSNGRIVIESDVFPQALNTSYQLPQKMGYYNPNTGDAATNLGLSRLLSDAVSAADADTTFLFADYDLVIVFHAGVGKDIDVGFDDTPQDIPSLFITSRFLKTAFGEDFEGVSADNGSYLIDRGIIMPETENQDGLQIAMTGILVSNIGSYLGLYDLFSPTTQRSGVGRFDLMDVGLVNLNGLIPSPPGAYSRTLLGWDEPYLADVPQNDIRLGRIGGSIPADRHSIVKIPINDDEYYLLENRGDYLVNMDSLFFVLYESRETPPSYLEVLKTYFPDRINVSDSSGVLLSVEDYDWGLPGSGVLIWHIDERIITEKKDDNKINDDPALRGVDIEEADGSQDIGKLYSIIESGYQSELGTWLDFWFRGNPSPLYKNEFSTVSAPATRANLNNAVSHITLKNFSGRNANMISFDYLRDYYEPGFPIKISETNSTFNAIVAGKVENFDNSFLFGIDNKGIIYAVGPEGKGLLSDDDTGLAEITAAGGSVNLVLADADQNGQNDFLFASTVDSVYGFDLRSPLAASLFTPVGTGSEIITPLIVSGNAVYFGCSNDTVYTLNFNGDISARYSNTELSTDFVVYNGHPVFANGFKSGSSAIAPMLRADELNLIIYDDETGFFRIFDVDGNEQLTNFKAASVPTGQFVVADLDDNGTFDIVYAGSDKIYAINARGFSLDGFPIRADLTNGEMFVGSPLVLDADGSGDADLLLSTDKGQVRGYRQNGRLLQGYPLAAGGVLHDSPVVLQLDGDEQLELAVRNLEGSLYVWQLPVTEAEADIKWGQANLNEYANVLLSEGLIYKPISSKLMPANRVYNYPNPNEGGFTKIRYYLNEPATVKIRIFDTAGMAVASFEGPGYAGADNEVVWNVSGIASGIYLCQIDAKADGKSESKVIKIMVVH